MSDMIDFIKQLIAGKKIINGIYEAVNRAKNVRKFNNGNFCYTLIIPDFGSKTFSRGELLTLDNAALCTSFSSFNIQQSINDVGPFGLIVLLFLLTRKEIEGFYQSYYKALYMKSVLKQMCIVFKNPFVDPSESNSKKNCICLSNFTIISLFESCDLPEFNIFELIGEIIGDVIHPPEPPEPPGPPPGP